MDPFIPIPRTLRPWAILGVLLAAAFAVWMFFFPQFIPSHFAWVVEPRLAQAFIGAGYVFRTLFFLQFLVLRNWLHVRWTLWGNLAFTGTLLLGDGFIRELYVHMGFHPAWKYERVTRLELSDGLVTEAADESDQYARLRRARRKEPLQPGSRTGPGDIAAWIRDTFDRSIGGRKGRGDGNPHG